MPMGPLSPVTALPHFRPGTPEHKALTDPVLKGYVEIRKFLGQILQSEMTPSLTPQQQADIERLKQEAKEIHVINTHFFELTKRTTAVLLTREGELIYGSGVRDLSPDQRRAVESRGGLTAKNPDEHAEVTVLMEAEARNLTPVALAIFGPRPICPDCGTYIAAKGGVVIPPKAAIFPANVLAPPGQSSPPPR
jgi:hypothetical protein